jgi:hypothetical protein
MKKSDVAAGIATPMIVLQCRRIEASESASQFDLSGLEGVRMLLQLLCQGRGESDHRAAGATAIASAHRTEVWLLAPAIEPRPVRVQPASPVGEILASFWHDAPVEGKSLG